MSLTDSIALGGQSFVLTQMDKRQAERVASQDTLPTDTVKSTLIMDHTIGAGVKPDRHLVKLTRSVQVTDSKVSDISAHLVITVPKGMTLAQLTYHLNGSTGMAADFVSLLGGSLGPILVRLSNNELS